MTIRIDKTIELPELDAARLFLTQLSLAYIFAASDAKYTNTLPPFSICFIELAIS